MLLSNLRHLTATIQGFDTGSDGNCFQRSLALVLDVPTAKMVVGCLPHRDGSGDYLHCWVEDRGHYYDPSLYEQHGGQLNPIQKSAFEQVFRPTDVKVLDRKWVVDFAKSGNLSAWIRKPEIQKHGFDKTIGETLLDRIGYPYRVENMALLPVEAKPTPAST